MSKLFLAGMTCLSLQMVKKALPSVTAPHCRSLQQPLVLDPSGGFPLPSLFLAQLLLRCHMLLFSQNPRLIHCTREMGAPVVKKSKVPVVLLDLFQQLEGGY